MCGGMKMCFVKKNEEEIPIYEVRGNSCRVVGDRTLVEDVSFRKIKNFLKEE